MRLYLPQPGIRILIGPKNKITRAAEQGLPFGLERPVVMSGFLISRTTDRIRSGVPRETFDFDRTS